MKKVFLDTSLFIRLFTKDLPHQHEQCEILFQAVQSGRFKPYISNIVLAEIVFVLSRTYRFPKQIIIGALGSVLKIRNLTLLETTSSHDAIKLYRDYSIKYQDCLIVTQLPDDVTLVSYDREFNKILSIDLATPDEIINKI